MLERILSRARILSSQSHSTISAENEGRDILCLRRRLADALYTQVLTRYKFLALGSADEDGILFSSAANKSHSAGLNIPRAPKGEQEEFILPFVQRLIKYIKSRIASYPINWKVGRLGCCGRSTLSENLVLKSDGVGLKVLIFTSTESHNSSCQPIRLFK